MQENSLRACLALHHNSSLSNSDRCALLSAVDSPEQIFELARDELSALGLSQAAITALGSTIDSPRVEQDLASIAELAIVVVTINSPDYPSLLKEIHNPPALLYVRGDKALLQSPQLAIVGSRRCSKVGAGNAFSFAKLFAAAGCTVTSGMALGVDAEGHRGALAAGGKTIAVLGTGVDVVYPRRNADLYDEILNQGTIVSHLPLGAAPLPGHFPSRNRLISGMSLGVLVVEAAPQSGSLITARLAMEQNREVFAIPGSIHNPASRGCHALIREGATLVETADHILEELAGWLPLTSKAQDVSANGQQENSLEPKETELLALLGYERQALDYLQQQCGWGVPELMATLTTLEMKGLVESEGACYQRIKF